MSPPHRSHRLNPNSATTKSAVTMWANAMSRTRASVMER